MVELGKEVTTSHRNYTATPSERLVRTIERFLEKQGVEYYSNNLPIYEGLKNFEESGDNETLTQPHGQRIANVGVNYPSESEGKSWLDAAHGHFDRLKAFSGRQSDCNLHDIATRHWDGYWFGKDRMWGMHFLIIGVHRRLSRCIIMRRQREMILMCTLRRGF
ncbi:hypothetical protein BDV12DRAFT_197276 [Aspergillus spectabilis]